MMVLYTWHIRRAHKGVASLEMMHVIWGKLVNGLLKHYAFSGTAQRDASRRQLGK